MAKDQTTAPRKTTTARKAPAAKAPAAKAPAPRKAPARKTTTAAPAPPAGPPAGWYPDPDDSALRRYWDGRDWLGAGLPEHLIPADGAPTAAAQPDLTAVPGRRGATPTAGKLTGVITYRGRTMNVVMPTPDQLAIWQRTALKLQGATQGMGNDEIMRLLQRAVTLIGSVLVDEVDRDWVEEALLAGDLDLMGAAAIVTLAVEHLSASAKAKAPRTGPAPKARRKR